MFTLTCINSVFFTIHLPEIDQCMDNLAVIIVLNWSCFSPTSRLVVEIDWNVIHHPLSCVLANTSGTVFQYGLPARLGNNIYCSECMGLLVWQWYLFWRWKRFGDWRSWDRCFGTEVALLTTPQRDGIAALHTLSCFLKYHKIRLFSAQGLEFL